MNGKKISVYGHAFEKRVMGAFVRNGYALMQINKWKKNYSAIYDSSPKREFDLVLFNCYEKQFCIVECKAHLNPLNLVNLSQVELFYHKINEYGGKNACSLIVSDTDFSKPAKKFASKAGIGLMNGLYFKEFEKEGSVWKASRAKLYALSLNKIDSFLQNTLKSYLAPLKNSDYKKSI